MADTVVDVLIIDLLEWLSTHERSYEEVLEAWRTSCPRPPVWEDANDRGLVTRIDINGRGIVGVSPQQGTLLNRHKTPRR
jgi:D-3-phosphoglycerate dehydrogenase